MPGLKKHGYARYTLAAVQLLGRMVRVERIGRRMTAQDLADRLDVARGTVQRLEQGDPKISLGVALEACALLGVQLFRDDRRGISARLDQSSKRLAQLPKAARSAATGDRR